MKTILLAATGALVMTASAPALAQTAPEPAAAPAAGKVTARASIPTLVQRQFARVDANKDGFVTVAEAQARKGTRADRAAIRAQRSTQRSTQRTGARPDRFARLDANADGMLSRAEFDSPRDRARRPGTKRRAGANAMGMSPFGAAMLPMADANKDGRVTLQEATAMALRQFDSADANRDGTVTHEERRQMRRSLRAAPTG